MLKNKFSLSLDLLCCGVYRLGSVPGNIEQSMSQPTRAALVWFTVMVIVAVLLNKRLQCCLYSSGICYKYSLDRELVGSLNILHRIIEEQKLLWFVWKSHRVRSGKPQHRDYAGRFLMTQTIANTRRISAIFCRLDYCLASAFRCFIG